MRCAYFVNMYPAPSHTTMRREVVALRDQGHEVSTFAVRPFELQLPEPQDVAEMQTTLYLRKLGWARALSSVLRVAATRPVKFARALADVVSCGVRSGRGVVRHFANLIDACLLLDCLRKHPPFDVVHAHFTTATTIAVLARRLGGPPVSLGLHGPEEFEQFSAWEWAWKGQLASLFAAVCNDTATRARACMPLAREKVSLVRCGLDACFLGASKTAMPQVPRFVCVARMENRKRHDRLLRAFAKVRMKHKDAQLVLIGDGPTRAKLEATARDVGGMEFVGWANHEGVRAQIVQSRCLVLPSDGEGLPIVIMEALALCRPVIATDVGGVRELVQTGKTGWLIQQGDETALATSMLEVIEASASELEQRGMCGRELVLAQHTISRNMTELARLWQEKIIDQTRSKPM